MSKHQGDEEYVWDSDTRAELLDILGISAPDIDGQSVDEARLESPQVSILLSRIQSAVGLYKFKEAFDSLSRNDLNELDVIHQDVQCLIHKLGLLSVNARATLSTRYGVPLDGIVDRMAVFEDSLGKAKMGCAISFEDDPDEVERFFLERLVDIFFAFYDEQLPDLFGENLTVQTEESLEKFIGVCLAVAGARSQARAVYVQFRKRYLSQALERTRGRQEKWAKTKAQSEEDPEQDSGAGSGVQPYSGGMYRHSGREPAKRWKITVFYREPTFDLRRGTSAEHLGGSSTCIGMLPGKSVDDAITAYSGIPPTGVSWIREASKVIVELVQPQENGFD